MKYQRVIFEIFVFELTMIPIQNSMTINGKVDVVFQTLYTYDENTIKGNLGTLGIPGISSNIISK